MRFGDLSLRVPTNWRLRHVQDSCADGATGVLVSDLSESLTRSIHHPSVVSGCSTEWDLSRLGAKYAVISLDNSGPPFPVPPNRFPLEPSGLFAAPSDLCHCSIWSRYLAINRATYYVRAYVGRNASASERKEYAALIRSIAPVRGH